MAQETRRRLRGTWYDGGFITGSRPLDIVLAGGRIYDAGLYDIGAVPRNEARLTVDSGSLRGWGEGVTFEPDPGELDRATQGEG